MAVERRDLIIEQPHNEVESLALPPQLTKAPERILVYGKPGTGKSFQGLKIAEFSAPLRAWVIDTDMTYQRMLDTQFPHLHNLVVCNVYDWPSWIEALTRIRKEAQRGELVIIDRAEIAWEEAQNYYVTRVFGEDPGEWFLKAREEFQQLVESVKDPKKKPHMALLEGDKDWQIINKMFKQYWNPIIMPDFPAHLYIVTSAQGIEKRDAMKDPTLLDIYGPFGERPTGQKHLPHQVHTIFHFSSERGQWQFSTVKDRGREMLFRSPLHSLPYQYLVPMAGWRPAFAASQPTG